MADKEFVLNLGKLMVAAAWADGNLEAKEINALKELLFLLPDISGEEWMRLELYMESPVSEEERQQLLTRVLNGIATNEDKALALSTLEKLVHVDGEKKEAEAAVVDTLRQDIDSKSTGLLAHLGNPLRRAISSRTSHYGDDVGRESRIDDYIKNTVYFQLVSEMKARGLTLSLPEEEIRKVCLAAGIMARVAWVDKAFCEQEQNSIARALAVGWNLPEDEAQLIMEISHQRIMKGLDFVQLTKGYCARTTVAERRAFLKGLFAIANAAGKTSSEEIEEIRAISKGLELGHQEFIDAKLTISREYRSGL
ncbi:tellurite resistance TerB family protein [Candidatus Nitrospira salsa]